MIKAVIVDDDKSCITTLEKLLDKFCPTVALVGYANTIKDAAELVSNKKPDLIFLDVELNGETGFDLLKQISTDNIQIIFTTAHEKYAFKAIKSSALEYLLKPVDQAELMNAVAKFEKQKQGSSQKQVDVLLSNIGKGEKAFDKIIIPGNDSHTFLNTSEIVCCEADMNYTNVFTAKGEKIVSTKNLKEFEDALDPAVFFRCHKSWLINLHCIKKFLKTDSRVLMQNDMLIDISVRKKDEFLNLFKKF